MAHLSETAGEADRARAAIIAARDALSAALKNASRLDAEWSLRGNMYSAATALDVLEYIAGDLAEIVAADVSLSEVEQCNLRDHDLETQERA